jgi:predicted transposase/invertase (TIGR01784 family)
LTYLDKDSPQELVEEVIKMDIAIKKAETKMRTVSQDDEALRWYEIREKALSDWASGVSHARMEGRKEGEMKKEREIARNALTEGASIEFVKKITSLDLETIKSIQAGE